MSTSPPSTNESLSSNSAPSVVYDVQTAFANMHKPTLVAAASAVYFAEMLVTHPLEVIRTQIQASQTASSFEIFRRKLRSSGWKGLYAGFMPASIGHLPGNTIYLLAYTYLKDVLQKREDAKTPSKVPDGRQSPWVSFVAAAGADLSAIALYCPVDVVVQRLFLQDPLHPKYASYSDVITAILKTEGWKGLYRGVGPIIINSVPASAVWWTIYEECKTYFSEKIEENLDQDGNFKIFGVPIASGSNCAVQSPKGDKSSTGELESKPAHVVHKHAAANIAAGGVAGSIVTFLTNPLDVVRTRLQTQSMKAEAYQYTSSMHTIKEMWKTEGVRAFFKGTTPRLAQWVFFSSASAFAYEFVVDVSTIRK